MRRAPIYATTLVFATACAAAGRDSGGGDHPVDATPGGDTSGPPGDGPDIAIDGPPAPVSVTLTQTTNSTSIGSANSVACGNQTAGTTSENSWYRVFRLSDHNIANALVVSSVTFGIQEASGSPSVQVKVGTYSGNVATPPATLDVGLVTAINTATTTIPNTASGAGTTVTVPITATIPAMSNLIVEVFAPDLTGTGKYFYIGGNAGGESRTSYLRAPACSTATPTSVAQITAQASLPASDLVISVAGTH